MPFKFGFAALEVTLELAETLAPSLKVVKSKNKNLADQMQRAIESIALNLGEGSRSQGMNRERFFWIASGSLEELVAALRLAKAFGALEETVLTRLEPVVDRLRGLLWGLTHPKQRPSRRGPGLRGAVTNGRATDCGGGRDAAEDGSGE